VLLNAKTPSLSLIQVVDADNASRLETCAQILRLGHEVIEARDAANAMVLAQTRLPQTIIIRYDLRDEEGTELCARLKAQPQTAAIPILMLVPNVQQLIDLAYKVGADDVLVEPMALSDLEHPLRLLVKLSTQTRRATSFEKRAHQMFHENRAVMLMIDPHSGRIIDANRAACSFYGYRHDTFTQMVLADLDAPLTDESDFMIKTTNLVMRHKLANSEIRDVTLFSGPVEVDGSKHVCVIVHDLTKRKVAEVGEQTQRTLAETLRHTAEQLEREQAQLRAILDSMQEGVMYGELDIHQPSKIQIRYINRALEALTGFSQEDWSQNGLRLFQRADVPIEHYEMLYQEATLHLAKRGTWMTEIQMPRKDGSHFTASFSVVRLETRDGTMYGAVGVVRDISQEKALAEQRSRFVAHASHELRTPLTNAKTRLYLIRKQPERLESHLEVLEDVIDRMRRLVETLLDLSRLERGSLEMRFQEVDLVRLLGEVSVVQMPEAERKHLWMHCELPKQPLFARVDKEQLTQVLINLITNAINYTTEGGITVRLSSQPSGFEDRPSAVIEVADTGIGIAQEDLANIFQPFFRVTSDVQGTGLGLSIAREIISRHSGEISVRSTPGQGSTFTVVLPLSVRSAALTEA
jgi:PAS domain S-box-containing protein